MRLLGAAIRHNQSSLQCSEGRRSQRRLRVFIYSPYQSKTTRSTSDQKIILSLTTSTQQMILRIGQSTPPAILPKVSPPPSFQLPLYTPAQPPPALPPSSALLADDSTNIVDIIISFASSLFPATRRRPTPVDTLDAPTLPATALPPPRSPLPRSSLMMAQTS